MEAIKQSAEHHFLATLEDISHSGSNSKSNWVALAFHLSGKIPHTRFLQNIDSIDDLLQSARQASARTLDILKRESAGIKTGYLYHFADGDILGLYKLESDHDKDIYNAAFRATSKAIDSSASTYSLAESRRALEKLAAQKLVSAKRFESYAALKDKNKIGSIRARRARNEQPRVLLIEDDRFTAAYAANILSKDYDMTLCRTGEEGLLAYIEHAPDIVLLDIHLPGMSGHETLEALFAIDPTAFVVMLSVDTVKENILQASKGGAKTFLKKPFSKERLINTVKTSPYVRGGKVHLGESAELH